MIDVKTEERFGYLMREYDKAFVEAIRAYAGYIYTAVAGAGGKQGIVRRGTESAMSVRSQRNLARKNGGFLAPWQYPTHRRPSKPGKPPRNWGSRVSIRKAMWIDLVSKRNEKVEIAVGPRKMLSKSGDIWNLMEFGGSKDVFFIAYLPSGKRDEQRDGKRSVRYEARPFMRPGLEKGTRDFKRKMPKMFDRVSSNIPGLPVGPQA